MAEQTPYEQLGVTEDASFDEIQLARQRLMAACGGDRQEVAAIESAYDAVLMHRLRLRQAGKIKVPDRIRFAEETSESALSPEPSVRPVSSPEWLKSYLDQPSPNDILGSGLILGSLAGIILFIPALSSSVLSVLIVAAYATSTYFLNRKENRLGRSLVLSLGGVIIGSVLGYIVLRLFLSPLITPDLSPAQFVTAFSFIGLWWTCSFLR
ncbi:MAG: CPP1-like family protein [Prochlorotrichaceae cyanobacterium]|jgi:hypothetical protein